MVYSTWEVLRVPCERLKKTLRGRRWRHRESRAHASRQLTWTLTTGPRPLDGGWLAPANRPTCWDECGREDTWSVEPVARISLCVIVVGRAQCSQFYVTPDISLGLKNREHGLSQSPRVHAGVPRFGKVHGSLVSSRTQMAPVSPSCLSPPVGLSPSWGQDDMTAASEDDHLSHAGCPSLVFPQP